jgi:hypothetical protein
VSAFRIVDLSIFRKVGVKAVEKMNVRTDKGEWGLISRK